MNSILTLCELCLQYVSERYYVFCNICRGAVHISCAEHSARQRNPRRVTYNVPYRCPKCEVTCPIQPSLFTILTDAEADVLRQTYLQENEYVETSARNVHSHASTRPATSTTQRPVVENTNRYVQAPVPSTSTGMNRPVQTSGTSQTGPKPSTSKDTYASIVVDSRSGKPIYNDQPKRVATSTSATVDNTAYTGNVSNSRPMQFSMPTQNESTVSTSTHAPVEMEATLLESMQNAVDSIENIVIDASVPIETVLAELERRLIAQLIPANVPANLPTRNTYTMLNDVPIDVDAYPHSSPLQPTFNLTVNDPNTPQILSSNHNNMLETGASTSAVATTSAAPNNQICVVCNTALHGSLSSMCDKCLMLKHKYTMYQDELEESYDSDESSDDEPERKRVKLPHNNPSSNAAQETATTSTQNDEEENRQESTHEDTEEQSSE